jgi:hypothetical protein
LATQLAHALQQLHSLSIMVRHSMSPALDNTHPRYSINPVRI